MTDSKNIPDHNSNGLIYKIGITLIPGVGDVNGKKLIAYCGGAEAIFKEKKKNLLKIPGIGEATVNSIISQKVLERAEKEIEFIDKYKITPLFFSDKAYPQRLKHCTDSPLMLYYMGNTDLNNPRIISIVGTRRASEYGREICNKIIEGLTDLNVLVISGLAYGIDTNAHKTALKNNLATVGILAHGLDRIYPGANKSLAEKMVLNGGLLTDFLSKTNPDRENFPKRNRIIAGISDATIVIESAIKGGALITANIANSYNRDVFAVPGKLTDKYSEGCNFLIKTNRAALIQSAKDVKYIMRWESESNKTGRQKKLFIELKPEEELVIDILKEKEEVGIDYIVLKSKLSNTKIASILLNLEFEGIVKCMPGKMFKYL
ncbi:MAG: DNA protecting protein DprA [Bacteroidetes bacterium 4484_249]|nr:MAG: DNA protecting protein DprA [Bacteroidetes bacterium 4484_249]